jgi:hypothetical protein
MFAFSENRPELPQSLAAHIRPVTSASARVLPLGEPWATLIPERSLRRGSTISIHAAPGDGGLTVAFGVTSELTQRGHWLAVVGVEEPGVVAMSELGIDLRRVLFVSRPRGEWAASVADLFSGVDAVIVKVPVRAAHADARRLSARARENGTTLIVLTDARNAWPVPSDLTIEVVHARWLPDSRLRERVATVRLSGRGGARREREYTLALPDRAGAIREWSR